MLNFDNCIIANLVIHSVGNRYEDGKLNLSKTCFVPDSDAAIMSLLKNHFLSSFKGDAYYHFTPLDGNYMNGPIYSAINSLFADENEFYAQSIALAEHLYEQSNDPDIKPGELCIVLFRNCITEQGECDAIGIFKSEKKDVFLKIVEEDNIYRFTSEYGISLKKADKACLIINNHAEDGYKALVLDKVGAKEKPYWTEGFLGLVPGEDESYFQTSNYLNLCKDFVRDVYNEENEVSKTQQIDLMNRSLNFFQEAEVFSEDRFKEEVVKEPEVITAFDNFKKQYETDLGTSLEDNFAVSDFAIKDEKKYFKHVLKLDKNFHIYVHGQSKYIEKGYDEKQELSYYKLYFKNEE